MSSLNGIVEKIRTEVALFKDHWIIQKRKMDPDVTSTCSPLPNSPTLPQSQRKYIIVLNTANPLGYELDNLKNKDLMEMAIVYEATHALCSLSYTCNRGESPTIGTWNSDLQDCNEYCLEASSKQDQINSLAKLIDYDPMLSDNVKDAMGKRFMYGNNIVDIDPVVNDLCILAYFLKLPEYESRMIRNLIRFAEQNLLMRAVGRATPQAILPPRPNHPPPRPTIH